MDVEMDVEIDVEMDVEMSEYKRKSTNMDDHGSIKNHTRETLLESQQGRAELAQLISPFPISKSLSAPHVPFDPYALETVMQSTEFTKDRVSNGLNLHSRNRYE